MPKKRAGVEKKSNIDTALSARTKNNLIPYLNMLSIFSRRHMPRP
jgi:hypothetical protein